MYSIEALMLQIDEPMHLHENPKKRLLNREK